MALRPRRARAEEAVAIPPAPNATARGMTISSARFNPPMPAIPATRTIAGTAARRIMSTWESFPSIRPATISRALTRVVSKRPSDPRSFSPARLPASTAGLMISAIVIAIPSIATKVPRSSPYGEYEGSTSWLIRHHQKAQSVTVRITRDARMRTRISQPRPTERRHSGITRGPNSVEVSVLTSCRPRSPVWTPDRPLERRGG